MRINYIPDPPNFTDLDENAIVDRIRQRRGERGLIGLDKALLHAPPVANGWNELLGAVRTNTVLTTSLKETAICRIAILNKAYYELQAHAPILLNEGKMPVAGLKHALTIPLATKAASRPAPNVDVGIDEQHAAVLEYTDWMTLEVEVPERIFERVRAVFSEREVVELTATVGAYNCVSRFLVALNVNERNGPEGLKAVLKMVHPDLEGLETASR